MVKQTQESSGLLALLMSTLNAAGRSKAGIVWLKMNFMATEIEPT